jgi:predicted RNase H-like nuclease
MPTFVGLDLAWTARNESGICWFEGETPADLTCTRIGAGVYSVEHLADEVAAVNGSVIVAIDAPVLYTRRRWAEREIARRFGRYKASPHQAHHAVKQGFRAGIDLGEALAARGFDLHPENRLGGARDCRCAVEVYPHTIHVRLFELAERLPYKPKARRSIDSRRRVMQQYQEHLRRCIGSRSPFVLDNPQVEYALSPETAALARGAALKRLDDTLDGLTCALAAWLMWYDPSGWELIGDSNGYIVAPCDRAAPRPLLA